MKTTFMLVVLFAGSLRAQTIAEIDSVARVTSYITKTGRFGRINGSLVTRIEQTASLSERCTLIVTERSTTSSGAARSASVSSAEWVAPLSRLSPLVAIKEWSDGSALVTAFATLGDSAVTMTMNSTPGGVRATPIYKLNIGVETRAQADTLGAMLAGAIRSCGGQNASDEVRARLATADSVTSARLNAALGLSLASDVRASVLEACYAQLREKLKSPSSARFDFGKQPSMVAPKPDELTVLGELEAQNGFGAMKRSNYLCKLEKIGAKYLPTQALIY